MAKYWDIGSVLSYNRCFNLINGERSIGKSYTTQKFIMGRALKRGQEFIYLVRTQDEKKRGIFSSAFEKVLMNEFAGEEIEFSADECWRNTEDENGEKEKTVLGYCIAISECVKIKKRSFPNVKYLMFDEYMLEDKQSISYIGGWKEPDLFLNIYHTVDREEDRVVCFLLGNNTSFYNPYHMHKAFNIPFIGKGKTWCSENVLFQWATSSVELLEEKANSKFLRMIENSVYGKYAVKGDYTEDTVEFVESRFSDSTHSFSFSYNSETYGVWVSKNSGIIFVSDKHDPSCKLHYAFTVDDHKENTLLTKDKRHTLLQWLANNFKKGNVRFESMEIKKKTEQAILLLM